MFLLETEHQRHQGVPGTRSRLVAELALTLQDTAGPPMEGLSQAQTRLGQGWEQVSVSPRAAQGPPDLRSWPHVQVT